MKDSKMKAEFLRALEDTDLMFCDEPITYNPGEFLYIPRHFPQISQIPPYPGIHLYVPMSSQLMSKVAFFIH